VTSRHSTGECQQIDRDIARMCAHHRAVKLAPLLLLLAPSLAVAEERTTTVTLSAMFGALESEYYYDDYYYEEPDGLGGPRLTLSWEYAPLAMPATPGYNFGVSLVPELFGGAFFDDTRARGFIGAGLRGELKMAQREMGLLKVSARGAAYIAARGMVVGDNRNAYGEFAIGDYFIIGKTARLGFEGSLLVSAAERMTEWGDTDRRIGGVLQLYVGWQP
jgi:hypothetical protein